MNLSIYNLKTGFQNLLMPICKFLNNRGISPNQITIFTTMLSVVYAFAFYKYNDCKTLLLTLPVFMFIRMALNALDGMIASRFNKKSKIGLYLNELGDIISDTALFLGFLSLSGINLYGLLIFIFLAIISEYVGVTAYQIDGKRHYEGPMGKSDRVFLFGLGSLITYFTNSLTIFNILIYIGIILLIWTIYNRINSSIKEGKNGDNRTLN